MSKIKNEFAMTASQPGNVGQHGGALANAATSSAVAEMQSRLLMAKHFPRDGVRAMDSILNAFSRLGLAEQSMYEYSRGGSSVSGPSIRAAEAIAGLWGNIEFGFNELSRGTDESGKAYSEVQAYALDLETNTKRPINFRVPHWRDTRGGGYAITSERDIYELVSNQAQRRVRACILAIIPTDVTDKAMQQSAVTLNSNIEINGETIQKLTDSFAQYGVELRHLEARIQQRISSITPAQMISLRNIYKSMKDGMSDASDWFDVADNEVESGSVAEIRKSAQAATKTAAPKLDNKPTPKTAKQAEPTPEPANKAAMMDEKPWDNEKPVDDKKPLTDDDVPFA